MVTSSADKCCPAAQMTGLVRAPSCLLKTDRHAQLRCAAETSFMNAMHVRSENRWNKLPLFVGWHYYRYGKMWGRAILNIMYLITTSSERHKIRTWCRYSCFPTPYCSPHVVESMLLRGLCAHNTGRDAALIDQEAAKSNKKTAADQSWMCGIRFILCVARSKDLSIYTQGKCTHCSET